MVHVARNTEKVRSPLLNSNSKSLTKNSLISPPVSPPQISVSTSASSSQGNTFSRKSSLESTQLHLLQTPPPAVITNEASSSVKKKSTFSLSHTQSMHHTFTSRHQNSLTENLSTMVEMRTVETVSTSSFTEKWNNPNVSQGPESIVPSGPSLVAKGYFLSSNIDSSDKSINHQSEIEFWHSLIFNLPLVKDRYASRISNKLRQGIPDLLRGLLWYRLCKPGNQLLTESEQPHPLGCPATMITLYASLKKKSSPYEATIMKDIPRTFPHHDKFKVYGEEGQQQLFSVVKAYSLYNGEIGYCQGITFVVASLLRKMGEVESFMCFVFLMHRFNFRTLYEEHMPGLKLSLYQLEMLVEELFPHLAAHFHRHGISTATYASQWFLTFFTYSFPHEVVDRLFDVLFSCASEQEAAVLLMQCSLSLLGRNQAILLQLSDMEDVLYALAKDRLYTQGFSHPDELLWEMGCFENIVTVNKLSALEKAYHQAEASKMHCKTRSPPSKLSSVSIMKSRIRSPTQNVAKSSFFGPLLNLFLAEEETSSTYL